MLAYCSYYTDWRGETNVETMTVCTLPKPVRELVAGDIVVTSGRARYLVARERDIVPYHAWTYTRHNPDGEVIATGTMHVRSDSSVDVVCVTLDGAVVTVGSAEVTS